MRTLIPTVLLLAIALNGFSQSTANYCTRVTATVQSNPASITLHWVFDTVGGGNYTVARKAKNQTLFNGVMATLPVTATSFTDTTVVADSAYEYRVRKSGTITADGYIYCGIRQMSTEYRGKLLLVVDSTLNDSLSFEITRLMRDISGDGWAVIRIDVNTAWPDYTVKDLIHAEYLADSVNVKAVLLLGHVAVPYSGDINPDGHGDHQGAWPADVYYGCMYTNFTDFSINDSSAARPENRNVADDYKWDQSQLPGTNRVQLQVSRIDLSRMTAFGKTERQLLKTYLDKDHAYRFKNILTSSRGLIDDNFGGFGGEAFAINGWRTFAPILGDTNIVEADYVTTLDTMNYQWSYACGGGWYQGAGGVGNTNDIAAHNVKSIFTMVFGSYFGDWDNENNFLRAPLCAPEPALTSCWAGRPHWVLHHMALGENIGYCVRLSQNQTGICYQQNYGINFVHVALMGDLTLRQHIISPPQLISLSDTNENVTLTWMPSGDSVLGYHVYRSNTEFGRYYRVNNTMLTQNNFTDVSAGPGLKYYMVRAVRLEETPSGTYYNLSEGVADTISVRDTVVTAPNGIASVDEQLKFSIHPNPTQALLFATFEGTGSGHTIIEIVSPDGRQVSAQKVVTGSNSVTFDISALQAGVYFCRIKNGMHTTSKSFEVLK